MTGMVERIAAEIADMDIGDGVTLTVALTPWLLSPTKPPPASAPVAAAIRAIVREVLTEAREPSDAMVEAGNNAVELDSDDRSGNWFYRYHDGDARAVWFEMIDAALKEGQ